MQLSISKGLCSLLLLSLFGASQAANSSRILWNAETSAFYTSGASSTGVVTSGTEKMRAVSLDIQWGQIGERFTSVQDWRVNTGYSFAVENKENRPITMGLRIELNPSRTLVVGVVFTVEANKKERFYLDLIPPLDNNVLGMRSLPPLMSEFYTVLRPWTGSPVIGNNVHSWQLYYRDTLPAKVNISSLKGFTVDSNLNQIVDPFGQYTGALWTGKAFSDRELAARGTFEAADLAANPGPRETVGSNTLPVDANGKWRVIKSPAGKSYFRHPDGKAFWSLGMVSAKNGAPTFVEGRGHMFNWLPSQANPLWQHYGTQMDDGVPTKTYDFHAANLHRRHGSNWKTIAHSKMYQRLESWGFNTLGSGSDITSVFERDMPYVLTVNTDAFPTKLELPLAFWRKLADPFTPGFEDWMATSFFNEIRYSNGKKGFMGVFVDGENVWNLKDGTTAGYYMLPIGVLATSVNQPAKRPFIDSLQAKYVNISSLNSAWNTSFASWDSMLQPYTVNPAGITEAMKVDFSKYIKDFGTKYYSHVRAALTRAGLTGLFLGTKDCMYWTPEEMHEAAAPFVDVHSITYYAASENVPWSYFDSLSKPVLMAEFSFMGRDRGAMSGGFAPDVDVPTQIDRAFATEKYVRHALQTNNIIGAHWYSYVNQPMTGRPADGENFYFGMVDVTDTPYPEMVNMFRTLTSNLYQYRGW